MSIDDKPKKSDRHQELQVEVEVVEDEEKQLSVDTEIYPWFTKG